MATSPRSALEGAVRNLANQLRLIAPIVIGTVIGMLFSAHGPIGSRLYPPQPGAEPVGLQAPLLMLLTLVQAVGVGIALALLTHFRRLVPAMERLAGGRRGLAVAALLALAWTLASWVPHVSLHQHIRPGDLWALVGVEWAFHVSVVVAAAILARFVFAVSAAPARAVEDARHGTTARA